MFSSVGFSTPRGPFAGAAPLDHRPLSAIAATIGGGVPERRIQRIIAELVPVLESLHQTGDVCADISVHSVGLDESGRAHLMALSTGRVLASRLQALTPGYAPYELYIESADWPRGPWTDIYALSAVVYALIAGQHPPPATERCIVDTYQPLVTLGLDNYSAPFLSAIDAGLAMAPAARPQTMQAYAALMALPVGASVSEAVPPVPEYSPAAVVVDAKRSARRKPWRAILLGIATIALMAYWWQRLASQPAQIITHSELALPGGAEPDPMPGQPSSVPSTPPSMQAPASPVPTPASTSTHDAAPDPDAQPVDLPVEPTQDGSDATPSSERSPGDAETTPTSVEKPPAEVNPEPKVRSVRVSINVRPWGEIFIDGVSRGVTPPLKTVMLRPGKYKVTIRNNAQPAYTMTLVVKPGTPTVITHLFR